MERCLPAAAGRGRQGWPPVDLASRVSSDIGQGRVRGGRLGNRLGLNRQIVFYNIDSGVDSGGRFSKV